MEGPIPVFLTYLDLPNGLEGGSTANYFFWIFMLNKVCTAKREAILNMSKKYLGCKIGTRLYFGGLTLGYFEAISPYFWHEI